VLSIVSVREDLVHGFMLDRLGQLSTIPIIYLCMREQVVVLAECARTPSHQLCLDKSVE